jgi:hypothetical protein
LAKPIKFAREIVEEPLGKPIQECYVDGVRIACDDCEFVDNCPTHTIPSLKFCLCDETLADPEGYEKYVAKNTPPAKPSKMVKSPKRVAGRKKR